MHIAVSWTRGWLSVFVGVVQLGCVRIVGQPFNDYIVTNVLNSYVTRTSID